VKILLAALLIMYTSGYDKKDTSIKDTSIKDINIENSRIEDTSIEDASIEEEITILLDDGEEDDINDFLDMTKTYPNATIIIHRKKSDVTTEIK